MFKQCTSINSSSRRVRPAVFVLWFCLVFHLVVIIPFFEVHAASKPRYASLIIDAESGVILHQSNANAPVHPASLTKMMTLMMVFDQLKRGKLRLSDRIRISNHAASMVPSKLGLKPGSTIRVEDAILALVTKSANDIAVAVAEHLGRSESRFAQLMTRAAQKRGLHNTVFRNASGLHDPRQVTTAKDMARLAHILIYDYPEFYHYFSRRSFTYLGKTYKNHNHMMDSYEGMDGLKTGYIQASGFNLVASAVRGNRRLIGVVFGGRTSKARNQKMEQLLTQGFVKAGSPVMASLMNTPIPSRKPGAAEETSAQAVAATGGEIQALLEELQDVRPVDRWAMLYGPDGGQLASVIGEGDDDPLLRKRVESGLISVSAATGAPVPDEVYDEVFRPLPGGGEQVMARPAVPEPSKRPAEMQKASHPPILKNKSDWSIQIGAFTTRERTDNAIIASMRKLPDGLRSASAVVAPLKTAQGWIFRGRLSGYTQESAYKACTYLDECIPIPPETP